MSSNHYIVINKKSLKIILLNSRTNIMEITTTVKHNIIVMMMVMIFMLKKLATLGALQLRTWAHRFFATLAQRSSGARGATNPIYNLLPDILSALVHEPMLDQAGFNAIMDVSAAAGQAVDAVPPGMYKNVYAAALDWLDPTQAFSALVFGAVKCLV